MDIVISKSNKPEKKYKAVIDNKKTVHFGQKGASDMTQHKNPLRKDRYIQRHRQNEDWTKSGVDTSGFYSRWVSWSKPTIEESVKDLNKKYKDINFKYKK